MITSKLLRAATVIALASASNQPVLRSSVFDWDSLKAEPKPHGARRAVFESRTATMDELECHVTTLDPGQAPHASHRHVEEELMIVKEGTLEVVQNGVTNRAGPGSIIFHASSDPHSLRNVGDAPATYYVIKFYPPGPLNPRPQQGFR